MPLFRRPDGDLVKDVHPVRRMMPYLMRGRNESIIYHEELLAVGRARSWLREFNRARAGKPAATLFHLFLWACAKALHERPGLNRFVSGGRIYQRRGVYLSFAAKKQMADDAPLVTVKLEFPKDEPFAACVDRIVAAIGEGRGSEARSIDREVRFFAAMPGFVLRFVVALARWLDRMNLLPAFLIENDPMYTSLFLANLGSVGIDGTWHHLYEYGTCTLFGVMGPVKKTMFIGRDGKPEVKDGMQVRWSFDERVNDGLYCAGSLKIARDILEDPDRFLGDPRVAAGLAAGGEAPRASEPKSA